MNITKNSIASVKNYNKAFSKWAMDFSGWFLADIAYTLLPIVVIAAIKAISYNKENYLYLSPEWSFATIVSIGVAITNLIELKTEIQQDPTNNIYTGTRLHVLLLIASVIVLSLVVLREEGININSTILWFAQIGLLLLSFYLLYSAHLAKYKQLFLETQFPSDMRRGKYFKILNKKIYNIQKELMHLRFALRKHGDINYPSDIPYQDILFWEREERNMLMHRLNQLEQSANETMALSKELINSSIPETV